VTYLVPAAYAAILLIAFAFAGYPLVASPKRSIIQSDRGRRGMLLLRQREQLYVAIRELEFDRSLGKVQEEDYTGQRRALDAEAVSVLAQLDQLDQLDQLAQLERPATGKTAIVLQIEREVAALKGGEVSEAGKALTCSGCGAPNLEGHRFCPECGHRFERHTAS
jgi:NADH pyrophosphatase NudC (nudix superfamily)